MIAFLMVLVGIMVLVTIFAIIESFYSPRSKFNALEVGDSVCTKYKAGQEEFDDTFVPTEITKVLYVKRNDKDKVEVITFDNGVTITSYKDFEKTGWFIR